MTQSPDLLAVLREAREWIMDRATTGADFDLCDEIARIYSALRAHEAQGWRPITEANAQRALDAYTDAISSHPLATEEGTRDATRIRRIRLDAMIDALQTLAPPPETTT